MLENVIEFKELKYNNKMNNFHNEKKKVLNTHIKKCESWKNYWQNKNSFM